MKSPLFPTATANPWAPLEPGAHGADPVQHPRGAEVMSTRAVVLIVVGVTVAAFAGVALVALIVAA